MNVHLSFYGTHLLGPDPFTGELDLRFKPAASGASQLTLTCPLGGFAVDGKGPRVTPRPRGQAAFPMFPAAHDPLRGK